jgi:hypothetical protein
LHDCCTDSRSNKLRNNPPSGFKTCHLTAHLYARIPAPYPAIRAQKGAGWGRDEDGSGTQAACDYISPTRRRRNATADATGRGTFEQSGSEKGNTNEVGSPLTGGLNCPSRAGAGGSPPGWSARTGRGPAKHEQRRERLKALRGGVTTVSQMWHNSERSLMTTLNPKTFGSCSRRG